MTTTTRPEAPLTAARRGAPRASRLALLGAALVLTACERREAPSGAYRVVASKAPAKELLREVQQPRVSPGPGSSGGPAAANGRSSRFAWEDPAGFVAQAPPASMQGFCDDFYVAARQGEESHDTLLTSFYMSTGTIEANVGRWAGQFEQAAIQRQERISVGEGIEAVVMDIEGRSYGSAARLWSEGGPTPVRAIFLAFSHPGGGILTLRFIGPPAGIERMQPAFWRTVETLRAIG